MSRNLQNASDDLCRGPFSDGLWEDPGLDQLVKRNGRGKGADGAGIAALETQRLGGHLFLEPVEFSSRGVVPGAEKRVRLGADAIAEIRTLTESINGRRGLEGRNVAGTEFRVGPLFRCGRYRIRKPAQNPECE